MFVFNALVFQSWSLARDTLICEKRMKNELRSLKLAILLLPMYCMVIMKMSLLISVPYRHLTALQVCHNRQNPRRHHCHSSWYFQSLYHHTKVTYSVYDLCEYCQLSFLLLVELRGINWLTKCKILLSEKVVPTIGLCLHLRFWQTIVSGEESFY